MREIRAMKTHRQGERGQDHALEELPEIDADADVALDRQPAELDGEDVDQAIADDEARHREAHHREGHDDAVEQRALAVGGHHAHRHGDADGEDQGAGGERQGGLDALGDQLGHGLLEEEALAEIALQDVADPDGELRPDRLVEAELLADVVDLVGGGIVAGDHRRRIARREPQHEEDEHRHHREHGDDGDETTGDEVEHFTSDCHLRAWRGALASWNVPCLPSGLTPSGGLERASMSLLLDIPDNRHRRLEPAGHIGAAGARAVPLAEPAELCRFPARGPARPRRAPWPWPGRSRGRRRRAASPSPGRWASRTTPCRRCATSRSSRSDSACRPTTEKVWKTFQPPWSAGSFLVRRVTSVCQSIDCMSTLKPACSSSDLVTGAMLVSTGKVGRLHQHDRRAVVARFLEKRLGLLEVGLDQQAVLALDAVGRAAGEGRRCRPCSTRGSPTVALRIVLLAASPAAPPGGSSDCRTAWYRWLKRMMN